MPERKTVEKAREDKRKGKAPSTQAGEFVKEEMEHIREGKHGARSSKQAIAIGLSKARRAGVDLPPPKAGKASEKTRKSAARDNAKGKEHPQQSEAPASRRSRASESALKKESHSAASKKSLSAHAHAAAGKRTAAERSASAKKAARTRARNG